MLQATLAQDIIAFAAVSVPMVSILLFVFRMMMANALSTSNEDLLKKINGAYLKREVADVKFGEIDRRHIEIERHFDYLRDKG